jgi:hypothetical protein
LRDRFDENFKYPLFTNVKSGIRKMSEAPNLGSMDKIEPEDIAIILIERVADYCNSQRDALACLKEYGPNKINILLNIFLTIDERKIFTNMILNSNMPKHEILSDMIDEYEVRWKFKILKKISEFISNKLNLFLNSIIINNKLDNFAKLKRLKAFESVLEPFDLAVSSSLKEKRPLNKKDLYDWLARLADIAFIFSIEDVDKNLDQYEELEYHLGYYEILDDEEKIMLLELLSENINQIGLEVLKKIDELNSINSSS